MIATASPPVAAEGRYALSAGARPPSFCCRHETPAFSMRARDATPYEKSKRDTFARVMSACCRAAVFSASYQRTCGAALMICQEDQLMPRCRQPRCGRESR